MTPDPSTVLPQGAMPTAGALANPASTYSNVAPIPNASIQPASPISMPPSQALTPVDANAYGMLLGNQATLAQQQSEQAQSNYDAESRNNQSLSDLLLGKEAFAQQQAQEQGLPELQKQARDLRSTSMLQTAQYIQGIRNIDQKNISQGERNTAQIEAQRQNAIDSLLTNAQLSFVEGNIQTAQANIKTAVDLKYNAIEQRIANSDKVLERLGNLANRADAKAVQAAKERNENLKEQIAQKKADDEAMQTLILNAQVQQAPPDVIRKAQALFKAGKSKMEVAAALGPYAGDYWGTRVKIANYNKIVSETNKIDTQTSGLKLQPTGVVTTPNGDAVSLPNETLGAIGRLKLNETQSNAVAFVSRMIQADAAIKKQLGGIKPLGGFYETSGYDPTSFGSGVGRVVGSDQSRIYNTNAQDFIRAKLRKESGAVIGQDEFDADAKIYVPSGMGLDEKDLLLAETKRQEAIKSMIAQTGPAAPYLQQYFEQAQTQAQTFVSENPQLNTWYKNSSGAVTSTPVTATGYGFTDNQKTP